MFNKALVFSIFLLTFFVSAKAQIQPVTGITTNFNGIWTTTTASNNQIRPNNSHELLSFTYNGVRYSTGVSDATLTANALPFTPGNYRALPVAGLDGSLVTSTTATLLAMASLIDGSPTQGVATHPNINGKTIKDVLTDGIRGLDIGTGVTNVPSTSILNFDINSIEANAITDNIPDILISQIARPTGGNLTDIYGFYNSSGVLVGNTVSQLQSAIASLGEWRLDLFRLAAGPLSTTKPTGGLHETANGTREIRMSAYRLADFGITSLNLAQIRTFRISSSGDSDPAFIGYNASAINFRPTISTDLGNSVDSLCSGGTAILKVIATAANEGELTYQWQQNIANVFTNISNDSKFSGTTTPELRVIAPLAGELYRCIVTETGDNSNNSNSSGNFTIIIATIANPTIIIGNQPQSVSNCAGTPYNLFVIPTGGTGVYTYQWASGTSATGPFTNINGATQSNLIGTIGSGPAHFRVLVSNDGCSGSVTSNTASITNTGAGTVLSVNNGQRCGIGTVTLTASSSNGGTITWRNSNGDILVNASSYTTPSISADSTYFVTATLSGCITVAQSATAVVFVPPVFSGTLAGTKVPTGNPIVLSGATTAPVTLLQWQKNGANISGANSTSFTIPVAELSDATNYRLVATNGICPSVNSNNANVEVVVDLYSKAGENLNLRNTWGIETNGTGVTPVTFTDGATAISTRADHIFHAMHNGSTTGNIQMAGTFDVENAAVIITPGTTLSAGVFRRQTGTTGAFTGSRTSSIGVNGITGNPNASVLYFNQANNDTRTLKDLSHSSTGTTTLATPTRIVDRLVPTAGSIISNGNLTLVSDALGTAKVTERPAGNSNYVLGDVSVERYIQGIGTDPSGGPGRKWRLLTIPVIKPGENIRFHWAGGRSARNYALEGDLGEPELDGTIITGHGDIYKLDGNAAKAAGFDWFTGLSRHTTTSIRYYTNDGIRGSWGRQNHYLDFNATTVNEPGYMLYIRGDRKMASAVNGNGRTTLRPKGILKMGTITNTIPARASSGYVVLGNPYAAPLDMNKVLGIAETGNNNAIESEFHVWDSYLPNASILEASRGNWRLISKDPGGNWVATPAYDQAETFVSHLQSGQAVLLRPKPSGGTLTIKESHKDENNTSVVPFETEENLYPALPFGSFVASIGVTDANEKFVTIDGVRAYTRSDFSFDSTDQWDVPKMSKFQGEIYFGLRRGNKYFGIEAISTIAKTDTLFFYTQGLQEKIAYRFQLVQDGLVDIGGKVYLKDAFTGNEIELTKGQKLEYAFTPTNDSLSKAVNRFFVVMQQSTTLPITFTSARAFQKDQGNMVEWSSTGETQLSVFEIEKSEDGRKFSTAVEVRSKEGLTNHYGWFDAQPFAKETFYRIKSITQGGDQTFTAIMRVKSNAGNDGITIYPNPVKGKNFTIEMNGQTAGKYTLVLSTVKGEVILSRNIEFAGGSQAMNIQLGAVAIPAGVYMVKISKGNEVIKATKLIFE